METWLFTKAKNKLAAAQTKMERTVIETHGEDGVLIDFAFGFT